MDDRSTAEMVEAAAGYIKNLLEAEYRTTCLRQAMNLAAYKAQLIATETPGYNTPEYDEEFARQPSMVGMTSVWSRTAIEGVGSNPGTMPLIADMITAPFGGMPGLWPDVCARYDVRERAFLFIDPADADTAFLPEAWVAAEQVAQANQESLTTSREIRKRIKEAYEGLSARDRKELEQKPDETAHQHRNWFIRWAEARRNKRLGQDD